VVGFEDVVVIKRIVDGFEVIQVDAVNNAGVEEVIEEVIFIVFVNSEVGKDLSVFGVEVADVVCSSISGAEVTCAVDIFEVDGVSVIATVLDAVLFSGVETIVVDAETFTGVVAEKTGAGKMLPLSSMQLPLRTRTFGRMCPEHVLF
jgi:hypothetical protein